MRFTILCLCLITVNASSKSSLGTTVTNSITALVAFPPAVAYFSYSYSCKPVLYASAIHLIFLLCQLA